MALSDKDLEDLEKRYWLITQKKWFWFLGGVFTSALGIGGIIFGAFSFGAKEAREIAVRAVRSELTNSSFEALSREISDLTNRVRDVSWRVDIIETEEDLRRRLSEEIDQKISGYDQKKRLEARVKEYEKYVSDVPGRKKAKEDSLTGEKLVRALKELDEKLSIYNRKLKIYEEALAAAENR